jgi:hypothetical protein
MNTKGELFGKEPIGHGWGKHEGEYNRSTLHE